MTNEEVKILAYKANGDENVLWDSDLDYNLELNEKICYEKKKKPNYYLYIKFDRYPGDFGCKFIGYVFGINPTKAEGETSKEYRELFWRHIVRRLEMDFTAKISPNHEINGFKLSSYEDYQKFVETYNAKYDELLNSGRMSEYEGKKLELSLCDCGGNYRVIYDAIKSLNDEYEDIVLGPKSKIKDELQDLYTNYLKRTWQSVDDWNENTWYNVNSHFTNKKYHCDSIYVQLSKPLNEKWEDILLSRMKNFCESDIYRIIEEHKWLENFGYRVIDNKYEKIQLLQVDLVDKDLNVVKHYNLDHIRSDGDYLLRGN